MRRSTKIRGPPRKTRGATTGRRTQPSRRPERRVVNTRQATGFPDSEWATIRYSDEVPITTGGTYGQYTFRGNSCFDPDETGIGHQPMYFDQYAAVYSKYKVKSSRIRVTAANYNAAASAVVVLLPSSEIVTITSYAIAMEQPYAKRTEMLPVSTRAGVQTSVSSAISTERILGLSPSQFAGEEYSALTGATPSSVWYWNIAAFDIVATSVRLTVGIEYKVLFYDRRAPSLSYELKIVKSTDEQKQRQAKMKTETVANYVVPVATPTNIPQPISSLPSPPPRGSPSPWLPGWSHDGFPPTHAGGGF